MTTMNSRMDGISAKPGKSQADGAARMRALEQELEATHQGLLALNLELEERVDRRTAELRATQEELQKTNSELLQLTLELEDRVVQRTTELEAANAKLNAEVQERKNAEAAVHRLNAELEQRVLQRTAQLEMANRELEAFSYSVSHDLRAPLRSINGFSQALLDEYGDRLDETAIGYLSRVRTATQRMGQLIGALLDLSRVARAGLQLQEVNLSAVANSVASELVRSAQGRRAEFCIAPDIATRGDPRLLRVLMENLLENAWKFTSKREAARIEFGELDQEGKRVFFVRDNGIGFDMTYAHKLFEPFHRLHPAEEYPGTGIGLATVHRVARRHGGTAWAEGTDGKGATIFFSLEG